MKKLTKLEKELLDALDAVTFYAGHNKFCAKIWNHNPYLVCTCEEGKHTIKANILLHKFGRGYLQYDVDKVVPE